MKLNQQCIKDLLLEIEEKQTYRSYINKAEFFDFDIAKKYDSLTIYYAIDKLIEAHLIIGKLEFSQGKITIFEIRDITWHGHQFLNSIREK